MVKNIVSSHRQPLAANCSQSSGCQWPPVAASVRQHSLLSGSHLQPLADTRVAARGRQWPPAFSSHRQPLAATCSQSSGRQWPLEQVAASGRKWPQVAASGRKWPPLPKSNSCPSARSLPNQPQLAFETPNPNAFEIFWRTKWPGPMGLPGRQEISFNLHLQGLLNLATGARSKITIFLGHGTKSKGTTLWPTFGARKVAQPCLLIRQLGSWVSPRNVWACQKQIVRVANSRWHLQSMRNEFCTYSAWRISFCPAYCPDMVPTKTVCRRACSYSVILPLVRMHDVSEPPVFFRFQNARRLVMGPPSIFLSW